MDKDICKIQLVKGEIVLVDKEDFERLSKFKWYLSRGYAQTSNRRSGTILMHRLILGAKKGQFTDHINGDRLDNRRANLRLCSNAENMRNRNAQRNNKSGFKGVYWHKERKLWQAGLEVNGKGIFLGRFPDKIDAAIAYNEGALKYHGEFAKLNVIPKLK